MKIIPMLFALSLTALAACDNNTSTTTDTKEVANDSNDKKMPDRMEDDAAFSTEAASGGMMEVQLGQMAATHASDPAVKQFGARMVTDHTKANDELKALAAKKNITLPTAPGDKHQAMIDDMGKKTGADFDKAYIDMMVGDHNDDIDHFQNEADHGNDADIKAWAAGKVPILKEHLAMAKSTQDALKNKK